MLAETMESLTLDDRIMARLEGKSTLGRLGLAVHITAGFIDPGWSGVLTLELKNQAPYTIELRVGQPISQLSFFVLHTPSSAEYRGQYKGAVSVQGPGGRQ